MTCSRNAVNGTKASQYTRALSFVVPDHFVTPFLEVPQNPTDPPGSAVGPDDQNLDLIVLVDIAASENPVKNQPVEQQEKAVESEIDQPDRAAE